MEESNDMFDKIAALITNEIKDTKDYLIGMIEEGGESNFRVHLTILDKVKELEKSISNRVNISIKNKEKELTIDNIYLESDVIDELMMWVSNDEQIKIGFGRE